MGQFTRDIPRMLLGGFRGAVAGCLTTLVFASMAGVLFICLITGWWEHGSIAFAFDWQQSGPYWVWVAASSATLAVCVAAAAAGGGAFGRGARYFKPHSHVPHLRAGWIAGILGVLFGGLGGAATALVLGAALQIVDPTKTTLGALGMGLFYSLLGFGMAPQIAERVDEVTFKPR